MLALFGWLAGQTEKPKKSTPGRSGVTQLSPAASRFIAWKRIQHKDYGDRWRNLAKARFVYAPVGHANITVGRRQLADSNNALSPGGAANFP